MLQIANKENQFVLFFSAGARSVDYSYQILSSSSINCDSIILCYCAASSDRQEHKALKIQIVFTFTLQVLFCYNATQGAM